MELVETEIGARTNFRDIPNEFQEYIDNLLVEKLDIFDGKKPKGSSSEKTDLSANVIDNKISSTIKINYNIKYKFVEQPLTKSVNHNILNFKDKPLISIIILNYYENEEWLKSAINSIQNQWYKNWEICLISTSNINNKMVEYLESINNKKIKYLEIKTDFSSTINEAFKLVSGEYFTIVDGHDKITNNALYEVVKVINETKADFIYSDEDKINIDNTFCEPYFKPDFSPDTLLSYNYIKHLAIIKKSFIDMIDGYNSEFDGAFEYDLYLKDWQNKFAQND